MKKKGKGSPNPWKGLSAGKNHVVWKRRNPLVSADWAWLQSELLNLILENLIPISDYILFGVVCKPWQSVALYQKQQRISSCNKQLPILMVHNCKGPASWYSATRGKTYNYVPSSKSLSRQRLCGYSHGWLAYADDYTGALTLLNPFTGRTLGLPPIKFYTICQVVLSGDPSLSSNDYEAVVIIGLLKLAHFKSGGDAWTHIDDVGSLVPGDLTYCDGQFLVINREFRLINNCTDINTLAMNQRIAILPPEFPYSEYKKRLVESSRGDIMMVVMVKYLDFKVYKFLHLDDDGHKFAEIESIGEDAVFWSDHQAMCVSASGFSGCRQNSIYMVIENGIAIFDLGNRTVEWQHDCFHGKPYQAEWILPAIV